MPRYPAFNIKMIGRDYGDDTGAPRCYTQSMTKFQYRDGWKICQSVNRDHPYMRLDQGGPMIMIIIMVTMWAKHYPNSWL